MQWRISMEESREEGYEHGLKQGYEQGRAEIFRKYYEKLQQTAEGRKMTEEELLRNTAEMFDMTVEDVRAFLKKEAKG